MTKEEAIKHLKLIKSTVYLGNRKFLDALDVAISYLKQPERKKGKWIPHPGGKFVGFPYMHYECDQCRDFEPEERNFCPNCGADMRGEQDDEQRSN